MCARVRGIIVRTLCVMCLRFASPGSAIRYQRPHCSGLGPNIATSAMSCGCFCPRVAEVHCAILNSINYNAHEQHAATSLSRTVIIACVAMSREILERGNDVKGLYSEQDSNSV